ncbi:2OG-Fe(II) oxygenase family protein [Ceratobasidium sp. AG-Ba]|nr:2OG-Fe(II) oxygenase family protein [Ceratobasidium sp. AG-Ba]
MSIPDIPTIDLSSHPDPKEVSAAMSDLGFLFIKNGGTPSQDLVQDMFEVSKGFFESESLEEKEKVSITVQNQGWVRNRQESLDSKGNPSGDIKEAFNLSKFTADGQPKQPLPPTLKKHVPTISAFMQGCHELSMRLLKSFAETLQLPEDHFTSRHAYDSEQSSILRLLYYPPSDISEDQAHGEVRAGAHSDYGSLTLLFQKSLGGLQIRLPNGDWLDAPVVNDAVLVNIGDLFDFWSGGRYTSTVHRVTLPRGPEAKQARYSIAYFLHPTDDVLLARIPMQHAEEDQQARSSVRERFGFDADEQMTAREWLDRRLAATYKGRKDV